MLVNWIEAIATASATFVALYVGAIRSRVRLPKLSIKPPEADLLAVTRLKFDDGRSAAWARLQVYNSRRKNTAETVEVIIVSIKDVAQGRTSDIETLAGRSFKWVGRSSNVATIPPGVSMRVDVMEISCMPPRGTSVDEPKVRITFFPQSALRANQQFPVPANGQLEMTVAVSARDVPAQFYAFQVVFDVAWRGQTEGRTPIGIRNLRSLGRTAS